VVVGYDVDGRAMVTSVGLGYKLHGFSGLHYMMDERVP
jgi:hypothetical protein